MYRRRMEQDRQRQSSHPHFYSSAHSFKNTYFAPASVILILIGFGMFIHALQWRYVASAENQFFAVFSE